MLDADGNAIWWTSPLVPLLLLAIAVVVAFVLLFDHYSMVRANLLSGRCYPIDGMLYQPLMAQPVGEGMAIRVALGPWIFTRVLLVLWLLAAAASVMLIWSGLVYMEQTYNVVSQDLESEVDDRLVQVHMPYYQPRQRPRPRYMPRFERN